MSAPTITRREFLKTAGITLGASALAVSAAGCSAQPQTAPAEATTTTETPSYTFGEKTDMNKRILVAYATRSGSTTGVAEEIGRTLAEGGAAVDVRPVKEVSDLSKYDAVVVGSPIESGEWRPEAMEFMRTHQRELARKPFAAFLVCITLSMAGAEKMRAGVSDWLNPVRALARPVSEGLFAGMLNTSEMGKGAGGLAMRFMLLTGMWKRGDHRDWNAIRAWAESLQQLLG